MGKKVNRRIRGIIKSSINDALDIKFQSILHDIEYRLDCLYNKTAQSMTGIVGKIGSRDLNLAKHQLDGYTITDNSPVAGSVAWTACNIVYKGTNYVIQNGNSANKYIYWTLAQADKTIFLSSNTKPALGEDDVLVFINDGGVHNTVMDTYRSGYALLDGTITGSEIKNNSIAALNIANNAIGTTQLASGAVTTAVLAANAVDSTKIAANAVTSTALNAGAVTAAKIANNTITATQIANNTLTATQLANGAVGTTQLAASAVDSTKLAAGAVTATAIADSTITGGKIASGTITGTNIQNSSITGAQIGAGAVAADKLNTALHMLF